MRTPPACSEIHARAAAFPLPPQFLAPQPPPVRSPHSLFHRAPRSARRQAPHSAKDASPPPRLLPRNESEFVRVAIPRLASQKIQAAPPIPNTAARAGIAPRTTPASSLRFEL